MKQNHTFRVLIRRHGGIARVVDFGESQQAWDVFADALRDGASAYIWQGGKLIAYRVGPGRPTQPGTIR